MFVKIMRSRLNAQVIRIATAATVLLGLLIPAFRTQAYTCPCTIWPDTATPAVAANADSAAVELGVKFTADISGTITGIRFYKGVTNTGTHTASLWSNNGVRLATATFVDETPSGWQQANFDSPVGITANTTYIASYYAPVGNYASTANGLSGAVDNAPLHALGGSNGVYKYGGGFPANTYNSTNYWVDPVFSTQTIADTTAPTAIAVNPLNGSTNTPLTGNITAAMSEPLDPDSVNGATFQLVDSSNAAVAASVSYNPVNNLVTLDPTNDLAPGTYTATLKGGGTDPRIKDVAGNAMASDKMWSFSAAAPQALDQGPGGPILIIKNNSLPFSKYYAEILRAEGLNSFSSADLSNVTSTLLDQYDTVILGDMPLTAGQVTMLTNWVNSGGNLIAMHPDKQLASLLGLTASANTLDDAYVLVSTSAAPGKGITGQTMQYHGSADRYTLEAGTTPVATLYSNASTTTDNPAVTVRSVGTAGGQAAAFTYDLAKSIIYTRQGNPAWAGQDRDGNGVIRSNDLFYGNMTGDTKPDYVDLSKVAIPQADEQMRLLSNLINYMGNDRKPLAKFWYLPKGAKAAVVMAGDDHATGSGTKDTFNRLAANSPAGCNVANWECARATSWIYTHTPLADNEAASYAAQGFDIGSHISSGCANWTPDSLAQNFANDLSAFRNKYPSLAPQTGHRLHCIAWSDWATLPKTEHANGIRMDLNYYYWPGSWVQNRPGFMTGSGLPMRFGDIDGSMVDTYQVPSNLVNESGQTFPANINTELDRAVGPEGYYGAYGVHYDYSDTFDQQLVTSAMARGIPLVSVQQILDWTDGRNNSSLTAYNWAGNTLSFTASVDGRTSTMLRATLPMVSSKGALTGLSMSGTAVPYTVETIKGVSYAMFAVSNGVYNAAYTADTAAPTITGTSPANGASGVRLDSNVTATFSEIMDFTTINNATFTLAANGGSATGGTVSYDPQNNVATFDPANDLAPNTTYTATITGTGGGVKDLAGNALSANKVWSFTTAASNCPCSLWSNATPSVTEATDTAPVELGVKFTSDQNGTISGVRFYKGATNTGTHTISLWNAATGAQLATATVENETASGWQTASFPAPVSITAQTTYVASYYAPSGRYAYDSGYFGSSRDAAPLHAPASSATPNGVYKYGGGFPNNSYNATNYWVDPVFIP